MDGSEMVYTPQKGTNIFKAAEESCRLYGVLKAGGFGGGLFLDFNGTLALVNQADGVDPYKVVTEWCGKVGEVQYRRSRQVELRPLKVLYADHDETDPSCGCASCMGVA